MKALFNYILTLTIFLNGGQGGDGVDQIFMRMQKAVDNRTRQRRDDFGQLFVDMERAVEERFMQGPGQERILETQQSAHIMEQPAQDNPTPPPRQTSCGTTILCAIGVALMLCVGYNFLPSNDPANSDGLSRYYTNRLSDFLMN